jgi:methionine-rich copper-binding protein CopC
MLYRHLTGRIAVLLTSILLALTASAGAALAHTGLRSSNPKDGATLEKAPTSVELVFTEKINPQYVKILVTGPGQKQVGEGKPKVDGDTITQELSGGLANGRYRIAFRVVSADGHPVAEQLTFTLKAEPSPSPETSQTAIASASPSPTDTPSASSTTPQPATSPVAAAGKDNGGFGGVLLAAAGVVALAALIIVLQRRRRPTAH